MKHDDHYQRKSSMYLKSMQSSSKHGSKRLGGVVSSTPSRKRRIIYNLAKGISKEVVKKAIQNIIKTHLENASASFLQHRWKSHQSQQRTIQRCASQKIQKRYLKYLKRKKTLEQTLLLQLQQKQFESSTTISTIVRMFLSHKKIQTIKEALLKKKLQKRNEAVKKIQTQWKTFYFIFKWKRHQAKKKKNDQISYVTKLQALVRCHASRKCFLILLCLYHFSSTKIQTYWRGAKHRKLLDKMKSNAKHIQVWWNWRRNKILSANDEQVKDFPCANEGIKSHFTPSFYLTKNNQVGNLQLEESGCFELNSSSLNQIQSDQKEALSEDEYLCDKKIMMDSNDTTTTNKIEKELDISAINIQKCFRGHYIRNITRSAEAISKFILRFLCKKRYIKRCENLLFAVISIQCYIRVYLAKKKVRSWRTYFKGRPLDV